MSLDRPVTGAAAGCVLGPAGAATDPTGAVPDPAGALRAAFHLAVVAGPSTGSCLPLGAQPALVGRAGADLVLADALVSRQHLQARTHRGRVQVRDVGSANGTFRSGRRARGPLPTRRGGPWSVPARSSVRWPPRRGRRLTARWRDAPPGTRLTLGGSVLEVRPRPDLTAASAIPANAASGGRRRADRLRLVLPLLLGVSLLPLLATSGGNGWRWAMLALPLAAVVTGLAGARPGPDRTPGGDRPPSWHRPAPPAELDPAALLLRAAAAPVPARTEEVLRARLSTTARHRGSTPPRRAHRADDLVELRPDDRVALVGARADTQATARWVVAQLVVHHGPAVHLDVPSGWGWAAPLLAPGRRDPPAWHLAVQEAWAGTARTAPAPPSPATAVPGDPPASTGRGATPPPAVRRTELVLADRIEQTPAWCTRIVPVRPGVTVPVAWAATLASVVAAGHPAAPAASLPARVPLTGLLGPLDRLDARWATPQDGLSAPVGVDADGVVELDLAAAGPHALVAGTTGSGKSELLLSWLLGLAVRHSPGDLQLVLVDYKGGATFDPLAGLPHTAGVLTDLDPAATARALASLRAEVRRRERVLAAAGTRDLAELRARDTGPAGWDAWPPRLLVVVDEFRELAETHPEVLGALVRLAAQGRALGIHLVLATQRPGGAVGPDVRANLNVRVCLRVLETADSVEVLGVPDAANLPPVPGRALLRTDRLREIQVPWGGADGALPAAVVAAARRGWHLAGHGGAPDRPWAAPLPAEVPLADLPAPAIATLPTATTAATSPFTLPLARSDLPDEQRLGVWAWDGAALLVTGGPGTGRTQTLRTVVAQALRAGLAVHVVAALPDRFADLDGPALGTVVGADDPRRTARLLTLLRGPQPVRSVLVIDDADVVCEQLDLGGPPGRGAAMLGRLLREAYRSGLAVAVAGPAAAAVARWAEPARTRLVLSPRDETEALLAGVPRELRPVGDRPGRGVLLAPGAATVVQVARGRGLRVAGPPRRDVPRLLPLPAAVSGAELSPAPPGQVAIGRGGDGAGPVCASCGPGSRLLVIGPPGSGRTTALATVRAGLTAAGRTVGSLPGPGAVPAADVLLLDDLDRWPAGALDELDRELRGHPAAVVAAATTDAVVAAYRGPLATWRTSAVLLVLRPGEAPAQLTVTDLAPAVDPARPLHPGLGVLAVRGTAIPVQVARWSSGQDRG